jgi:hypothetical protein
VDWTLVGALSVNAWLLAALTSLNKGQMAPRNGTPNHSRFCPYLDMFSGTTESSLWNVSQLAATAIDFGPKLDIDSDFLECWDQIDRVSSVVYLLLS